MADSALISICSNPKVYHIIIEKCTTSESSTDCHVCLCNLTLVRMSRCNSPVSAEPIEGCSKDSRPHKSRNRTYTKNNQIQFVLHYRHNVIIALVVFSIVRLPEMANQESTHYALHQFICYPSGLKETSPFGARLYLERLTIV